jgi:hypothetical protein
MSRQDKPVEEGRNGNTNKLITSASLLPLDLIQATEFHVSTLGNDTNAGTQAAPLRTIQHAADLARPGDVITVHEGVYRERINPPRGGLSDTRRITYQAAAGEMVTITGSELVRNWVKVQGDIWKVTLINSFFGTFNPFNDLIRGDWFIAKGRQHHTGAVYLNGDWLDEATSLDDVLMNLLYQVIEAIKFYFVTDTVKKINNQGFPVKVS